MPLKAAPTAKAEIALTIPQVMIFIVFPRLLAKTCKRVGTASVP
jgi:hypothetical protein